MTLEELRSRYRTRILEIAEKRGARNVRVFGSIARGEQRADSDIDIVVDFLPGGGGPGPAPDERPDPQAVIRAAEAAGLQLKQRLDIPPFVFLLVFERVNVPGGATTGSG